MTNLDLVKFKEAAEKATPELVAALHSQRQLDFGGCEVGVSRQACDEAAEFIALARTAVPALIARLEAAEANLKWEQHRAGRIGTHSEDCHTWGPQHYECLLRKFNEAEARNATAYAEGVEAAAKVAENYLTMDHIAWDGHNSIFPKSSTIPD